MKIGIFDSGIGGLSVLHLALRKFPNEEFIYYADKKNVPYGNKTREEIIGFVDDIIKFFIEKDVDAVVIACNTATSAAAKKMRKKYALPIIGMEPAVKKAIDEFPKGKVLTAATPITVKGAKMSKLLEKVDKDHLVDLVALPKLVTFAEKGEFDTEDVEAYLIKELGEFNLREYSSFVLGCTHFNYFKNSFRKLLPYNVRFVDGNEGTLNHLAASLNLDENKTSTLAEVEYYFSSKKVDNEELEFIKLCMKRLDKMIQI